MPVDPATAEAGGAAATQGAVLTATAGANTAGVDTVFADGAGTSDAANDGKISAKGDYTVSAAVLTVNKYATLISDPINGATNPKMIPGAVVDGSIARIATERPGPEAARAVGSLAADSERLVSVDLSRPSLETVFLAVTGRAYSSDVDEELAG